MIQFRKGQPNNNKKKYREIWLKWFIVKYHSSVKPGLAVCLKYLWLWSMQYLHFFFCLCNCPLGDSSPTDFMPTIEKKENKKKTQKMLKRIVGSFIGRMGKWKIKFIAIVRKHSPLLFVYVVLHFYYYFTMSLFSLFLCVAFMFFLFCFRN